MLGERDVDRGAAAAAGEDLHGQRHLGRAVDGDVHRADAGRGRARGEDQLVGGAVGDLAAVLDPHARSSDRARPAPARPAPAGPARSGAASAFRRELAAAGRVRCTARRSSLLHCHTLRPLRNTSVSSVAPSRATRISLGPPNQTCRVCDPLSSALSDEPWPASPIAGSSGSPSERVRDDGAGEPGRRRLLHGGDQRGRRRVGQGASAWPVRGTSRWRRSARRRRRRPEPASAAHGGAAGSSGGSLVPGCESRTVTRLRHSGGSP